MNNGIIIFTFSMYAFFEYIHYVQNKKILEENRINLKIKLSTSNSSNYSEAHEYFKKCDDEESKMILHNITDNKLNKNILYNSLAYYCSPLKGQLSDLINILHNYHKLNENDDNDNFIKLDERWLVFKIPFIIAKLVNVLNYYTTQKLIYKNLYPIDKNHNVYMRYDANNEKTIIIFSGIVGGRLVLLRMLKYIPHNYNIIGVVYEEISYKFYEDIVYDILISHKITKNIVVYSWSYGTLFANKFITKYKNEIDIKLKVFCDIFGLPLNTLYMANICGTNDLCKAYKLLKLKVKPFFNGLLMFLLLKSEIIEKRIMTLTLNDYLLWSLDNLNKADTILFISNDDIMYNVDTIKLYCSNAYIKVFDGGHCSGINRKSLNILKEKLISL